MAFGGNPTVLGSGLPIASGGVSVVSGPASSTDNAIVRWDGTGGNLVQNSVVTVADTTGAMTWVGQPVAINAGGSDQNITLTPSGTGKVVFGTLGHVVLGASASTTLPGLRFDSTGNALLNSKGGAGAVYLNFDTVQNTYINASGGKAFIGTVVDSSNGILQLATHTTSAGGIGFGTDTPFYRWSSGVLGTSVSQNTGTEIRSDNPANNTAAYASLGARGNGGNATLYHLSSGYTTSNQYIANTSVLEANGAGLTLSALGATPVRFYTNSTLALTLDSSQNATFAGAIIGGVQSLSGAGAVNVTQLHTSFTSTGGAQALTLANGTTGQIKTITHTVDGGSGVLTPTTALGYTTITFTNAGDSVTLRYTSAGWAIVGIHGAVAA